MSSDERSKFGCEVALNRFMQEQAKMYSGEAWLTGSILPCSCDLGRSAALHGARYSARAGNASWDKIPADQQGVLRSEFAALPVAQDGESSLHRELLTIIVVAMHAMLTPRPPPRPARSRRGYVKYFEARSVDKETEGRADIYALAKLPLHSHGDPWVVVHMHLRHVEDCTNIQARERHYDALGGEPVCQWLRMKELQEYDKHRQRQRARQEAKQAPAAYQTLAIYEILSIERVFGGANTRIDHQETRSRGAVAIVAVDDTSGADDGDGSSGSDGDSDSP